MNSSELLINRCYKRSLYDVVVQKVAVGVLNLIPSEKYIPLRLHVIRGLTELSAETETFVPIMPMLVATIKLIQWNKKPKVCLQTATECCSYP